MDILEKIVKEDNKQRYSFNDDKTLIRANQGHSVKEIYARLGSDLTDYIRKSIV